MNHKRISTNVLFLFILFLATMAVAPMYAQPPILTPNANIPASGSDVDSKIAEIERKLFQLETTQAGGIKSLNESNERYRFLVTAFAAVLGALVVIQAVVTAVQLRREGIRDPIQNKGAKEVSEIMNVVKTTLQSRLTAEKEERNKATEIGKQLERVLNEVTSLREFVKKFQSNIQNERNTIEINATRLSQMPRHEFRSQGNELHAFAQQFDTFKSTYEPIEEGQHHSFTARALYIRGIAAHYDNDPEKVKRYLSEVIATTQAEAGEQNNSFKRRVANSHYYLGITELNFGNAQTAVDSFEHANLLDPDHTDFLTKLVNAEAYVMKGADEYGKAREIIKEVESGLDHKKDNEGHLTGVYLRLRSRALLIQANMAILKREDGFPQVVKDLLEQTHQDDPGYYYATATLAQACVVQGSPDEAKRLFREAYEVLEQSGDLLTVAEARSQILVRMIAALCSRHGLMDNKRSDEHLNKAESLRGRLPRLESRVCTVFSTLSKRNESSETIPSHMILIRKGKTLLEESNA